MFGIGPWLGNSVPYFLVYKSTLMDQIFYPKNAPRLKHEQKKGKENRDENLSVKANYKVKILCKRL